MLAQLHDELDDEQEMLPLGQMGLMMVDWLDPQKAVYVSSHICSFILGCSPLHELMKRFDCSERDGVNSDQGVHLDLAMDILKSILAETSSEFDVLRT